MISPKDDPAEDWACRTHADGSERWYRETEDAGACIRQRNGKWIAESWSYGERSVTQYEGFPDLKSAKATLDFTLGTG